jgi:3'-5' exoribonuclease
MLPQVFRLTSLHQREDTNGQQVFTAHVFHERAQMKVRWTSGRADARLQPGILVGPRWSGPGRCDAEGCVLIARLVALERPVSGLALFDTVPPGWVRERAIVTRAGALVAELPAAYASLFQAVFWDGARFRRFCTGPSSMQGHHDQVNGNLLHSVQVAEHVRALCSNRNYVHRSMAVLSALLHDAGKADEYVIKPDGNWGLSDRGKLLGHRVTVIEWIAAAMARWAIRLPEGHGEALLHNLSAVAHAPAWMGLREPQTPEAAMLSIADRLSGTDDLMRRCLPTNPGWGRYHRHLGRKPYRVAARGAAL